MLLVLRRAPQAPQARRALATRAQAARGSQVRGLLEPDLSQDSKGRKGMFAQDRLFL